eukprot:1161451-Pelagomonas_calceolata.AAC.1
MHMYARTHRYTFTRAHARTHARTHKHTLTHSNTHSNDAPHSLAPTGFKAGSTCSGIKPQLAASQHSSPFARESTHSGGSSKGAQHRWASGPLGYSSPAVSPAGVGNAVDCCEGALWSSGFKGLGQRTLGLWGCELSNPAAWRAASCQSRVLHGAQQPSAVSPGRLYRCSLTLKGLYPGQ